MKFAAFKQFRPLIGMDIVTQIQSYLLTDLGRLIQELAVGMSNLTLTDNFSSFIVQVTIASGAEIQIRNQLRNKDIPNYRLIVRGGTGSQDIVDGDTAWTQDFVYLKNTSGSTVTATVLFLR